MSKSAKKLAERDARRRYKEEVQRTGWPPGLLQDDSRQLTEWFASRMDARWLIDKHYREHMEKVAAERDS